MNWILKISFFICSASFLLAWMPEPKKFEIKANTPVWEVLSHFGEAPPNHELKKDMEGVSAELGRNIVLYGIADENPTAWRAPQSKHFVCTSCHNIQREDPDLSKSDPEARLRYVNENGLPFLQGTTLYGAVNRRSFYNDDYEKKYGDLVYPTRNNLREAIQLCAVECSQGRRLNEVELESVLSFLWTLELKLKDLDLDQNELEAIKSATGSGKNPEMVQKIKSHFLAGSPAHFVDPPKDRKQSDKSNGNADNGKLIYDLSCKHCHENERYSFFSLDDSKASFRYLNKHFPRYSHFSVYQVARYGTSPLPGKRAYMPQYPIEKMSHQQLEDLRAYVRKMAE